MKNCLKVSILYYLFLITNCFSQTDSDKNNVPRLDTGISGIVYVEGAELHYIVEGKGIPCIVLGHSLSQYRILSQALRDHFRFIFADLRHDAQSNSSLELSEITLNTYLNDINAILDTLDLEKAAIFAHSHHSFIAVEYARKYPDKVSHIIITGCKPTTALGEGDKFWKSDASKERKMIFKRNWKRLRKEGLTKMSPKERYIKTYSAMTPKLMYDPKGDLSYIVNVIDNNSEVFLHLQLTILGDYDIIKGPEISIPVFLALGRYDYECPYKLWEERKSVFLDLSYNLFEKSGHFPMVEEQDLFDNKLIDWIRIH
jgi:proline iminopeptidase